MYIPNPIPPGPHSMYVFYDRTKYWFKLGFSSNPQRRRKDICNQRYGPGSQDKIEERFCRTFQAYFSAFYLEQMAIGILEQFGFERVEADDWFEADARTMNVVIEIIDELADKIIAWEADNFGLECSATHRHFFFGYSRRETPYAKVAALTAETVTPTLLPPWRRGRQQLDRS